MTILFKQALSICGLSQTEAAEYLSVSVSSIKSWSRGKTFPRVGVWRDLGDLYQKMLDAADLASEDMDVIDFDLNSHPDLQPYAVLVDGERLPIDSVATAATAMLILSRISN